jgi:hypothetical protein
MPLRGRKLEDEAAALWNRRGDALDAGTRLLTEKPDREWWTREDYRVWRYAMAVSRRIEKIH